MRIILIKHSMYDQIQICSKSYFNFVIPRFTGSQTHELWVCKVVKILLVNRDILCNLHTFVGYNTISFQLGCKVRVCNCLNSMIHAPFTVTFTFLFILLHLRCNRIFYILIKIHISVIQLSRPYTSSPYDNSSTK